MAVLAAATRAADGEIAPAEAVAVARVVNTMARLLLTRAEARLREAGTEEAATETASPSPSPACGGTVGMGESTREARVVAAVRSFPTPTLPRRRGREVVASAAPVAPVFHLYPSGADAPAPKKRAVLPVLRLYPRQSRRAMLLGTASIGALEIGCGGQLAEAPPVPAQYSDTDARGLPQELRLAA